MVLPRWASCSENGGYVPECTSPYLNKVVFRLQSKQWNIEWLTVLSSCKTFSDAHSHLVDTARLLSLILSVHPRASQAWAHSQTLRSCSPSGFAFARPHSSFLAKLHFSLHKCHVCSSLGSLKRQNTRNQCLQYGVNGQRCRWISVLGLPVNKSSYELGTLMSSHSSGGPKSEVKVLAEF